MIDKMLHNEATMAVDYKLLRISSTAFENEAMIPSCYTCDGRNINPPLRIENIPANAVSLAIIVDDPDAPACTWVHWLAWNIPVTHHIEEDNLHGLEGLNDFQQLHYSGPCPPLGRHRYFFKIYALNSLLDLPVNTKKLQLEKAMSEHIIAFGELVGLYERKK